MKYIFDWIKAAAIVIGAAVGSFLGGVDGLLISLLVFVCLDYITGVLCAFSEKTVNSEIGFKGIAKKVLIFLLVGMANVIDLHVLQGAAVMRTAVIFFYMSNEGISICENAVRLGLPVPDKLKDALAQLKDGGEKSNEGN